MADLGAIGTVVLENRPIMAPVLPLAVRRHASGEGLHPTDGDADGMFSGYVAAGGVAQVGITLGLYHRDSKQLLNRTVTDASGNYEFTGVCLARAGEYFILAFDPSTGAPYMYTLAHHALTPGPTP